MSQFVHPNDPFLDNFRFRDSGGVHINSSIINRCYYLLTDGLPGAIGLVDGERIFYRYLTLFTQPYEQFIDARLGCIQAAEELFGVGSHQALKVAEAFDSVEISAIPLTPSKPPTRPAVSGTDSTLFIYYNTSSGLFDLGRKETAQGDGSSGSTLVFNAFRSRVTVSGDGSGAVFVGSDNSLVLVPTAGGTLETYAAGAVYSVAASPDGRYAAFVLLGTGGQPTNQIALIDFDLEQTTTVDLVTPVADGDPISNIRFADSMDFASDGSVLIYDALSTIRQPDGTYRDVWSLYALDVQTLAQHALVPPIAGLNIGNPAFSNTGERFITFEATDSTFSESAILVADLSEGVVGLVGVTTGRTGYPAFTGDDTAIIYADYDAGAPLPRRTSLYRQSLSFSGDDITPNGSRTLWLRDAELGVIYRRGGFPAANVHPAVTLTSPGGTTFTSLASFTLTANASDSDGTISKVEFYIGSTLMKTDTEAPYTLAGTGIAAGAYQFTARAFDNLGAATTTPPLFIRVDPPAGKGRITPNSAKAFEFRLDAPTSQPGVYRIEASTNLVNWTSLGTVTNLSDSLNFTDLAATNHTRRFYRAVKLP